MIESLLFTFFSAVALAAALGMVLQRQMIYSVALMIVVLLAIGGLFLIMNSPFLFFVQVIVYAGAVMVLFVFAVQTIGNVSVVDVPMSRWHLGWAAMIGLLLLINALLVVSRIPPPSALTGSLECEVTGGQSVACLGELLFNQYMLLLQSVGFLLLVALVGAIYLSHRSPGTPSDDPAAAETVEAPETTTEGASG